LRPQHREATVAGIGLGTTAIYMQRTTSGAAGNGLYNTTKYLRRTTSTAANNGRGIAMIMKHTPTHTKYLVN
jgi:hypothetical protein